MSKDFLPPTEAEEYRNTAEIQRNLAVQVRFANTRNELVSLADHLDRLAALSERQARRRLNSSPDKFVTMVKLGAVKVARRSVMAQLCASSSAQWSCRAGIGGFSGQ
jgi:hypothetical protein